MDAFKTTKKNSHLLQHQNNQDQVLYLIKLPLFTHLQLYYRNPLNIKCIFFSRNAYSLSLSMLSLQLLLIECLDNQGLVSHMLFVTDPRHLKLWVIFENSLPHHLLILKHFHVMLIDILQIIMNINNIVAYSVNWSHCCAPQR